MSGLRTVLVLSRFFPPMHAVGGKRAYRFARYLPELGWRAVVLTDAAPPPECADESIADLPPPHRVYRTWFPRWWPRPPLPPSDGTVAAATTAKPEQEGLLARLAWQLQMPFGNDLFLTPHVAREIRRRAAEERAEALFATSSPYSALLFGAVAKRLTGLPLHLDLRDPWSLNFLQRNKSRWTRSSEARAEAWVLAQADRITFTSESAARAYRRAHPALADRIDHIYNGFEPERRPPPPSARRGGPAELIHFGNCYGPRRLSTILRAVARLRDRDGVTPAEIRVTNLGRMAERDLALIDELGVADFVTYRTVVPYDDGLARLSRADLQILIGYGDETLFVPAKLFDYLLSGAPILAVARRSELTDIVDRTRSGRWVAPGDVDQAASVLLEAIEARRRGRRLATPDPQVVAGFSARNAAQQLASSLSTMVGER